MTSRVDAWGGNAFPLGGWISEHDQAFDTAQIIADKSVSITIRRGGNTLSAQTVRIETLASQKQMQGEGGITYMIDAMLLGYKGHPTITDTDVKPGDRFAYGNVMFEVIIVMPAEENTVQAYLRVRA